MYGRSGGSAVGRVDVGSLLFEISVMFVSESARRTFTKSRKKLALVPRTQSVLCRIQ